MPVEAQPLKAPKSPVPLEQAAWQRLQSHGSPEEIGAAWLMLQCQQLEGVEQAVLVLGEAGTGPYQPVAAWPTNLAPNIGLTQTAELGLAQKTGVVKQHTRDQLGGRTFIAQPINFVGGIAGVVCVQTSLQSKSAAAAMLRSLQWGVATLELNQYRNPDAAGADRVDSLAQILDSLTQSLSHEDFRTACNAFAAYLAQSLTFDRVSIGVNRGRGVRLVGFSGNPNFAKQANLIRLIEVALDEVVDDSRGIIYPAVNDDSVTLIRAHRELAKEQNLAAVASVKLQGIDGTTGGILVERMQAPISAAEHETLAKIANLCGPVLLLRESAEQPVLSVLRTRLSSLASRLFGPRHWLMKSLSLLVLVTVVAFSVLDARYRVTADAYLEGSIERTVAAPFDSYVASVEIKAGDVVEQDQLLATLDDNETRLDLQKWINQREQLRKQYQESTASYALVETQVIKAQLGQAQTQIDLLQERLGRTQVRAPFPGIVIAGDLTRSIGEPVERGQLLFKVSPLSDFRVALEVDERDIEELRVDQLGELSLAAMPDAKIPFTVTRLTPVSKSGDGRNTFRVEGTITEHTQAFELRPGMTGSGKVDVEDRKLIWIWTHRFFEWVRLQWWSWFN